MLPQPAALLPLVAEQLRNREPADRLPEPVGARRHHARQRRRHLRPQRHLPRRPCPRSCRAGRRSRRRSSRCRAPAARAAARRTPRSRTGCATVRHAAKMCDRTVRVGREKNRESPAGLGVAWATRYQRGSGVRGRPSARAGAQGSSPSRCITSPTVWNDPVTSTVPAPSCAASTARPKVGLDHPVHAPGAGGRSREPALRSASRFHPARPRSVPRSAPPLDGAVQAPQHLRPVLVAQDRDQRRGAAAADAARRSPPPAYARRRGCGPRRRASGPAGRAARR